MKGAQQLIYGSGERRFTPSARKAGNRERNEQRDDSQRRQGFDKRETF
jgi:hypothetical protein